ncbi:type I restriction endonuclease [Borreliella kurtenbachii]|uniref:type I restriction endonuclease n=1 Tax=Borreliella kurtenbachii TaxID=1196056 RepID=UPI00265AA75E|nr:type I restriction enzyme HsdR N-terminal domain-containing protein [Borreliella kurtenbachii]WKC86711.1 type I restriction enzyme HsdR N-terminal domain-containing protein [Borreliella kurtenbachii]
MSCENKDINFIKSIKGVIKKIRTYKDYIENEAQTKNNFISPFLNAMGYDHTDLSIVKVEATADFLDRKGMKVDYILYSKDRESSILIEAKHHKENLDNHFKQLSDYFYYTRYKENTKKVEFGILTNGIEYRFYTDLDKENLLDKEPFLIVNLEELTIKDFEYLKKFSRNSLNIEEARGFALEKKYTDKFLTYFKKEIKNTSDDFLEFFKTKIGFKKTYSDEIFKNIIKNAFNGLAENNSTLVDNKKNNKEFTINSSNSNDIKTKNLKMFEKLSSDMKLMYQKLESFIFNLNPREIEKIETKLYTGFKVYNKYFVDFSFRASKINITVTVFSNQITLKEGFIRDISNIGKWGSGNIQIICTSDSQIQEIKDLIKLSYNNIASKYKKIY